MYVSFLDLPEKEIFIDFEHGIGIHGGHIDNTFDVIMKMVALEKYRYGIV